MKVLVTGASGFIGRYLIPALLARGDSVIATDLFPPKDAVSTDKLVWKPLDVSRSEAVYKIMLSEQPDAVIHLVSWLAAPCDADPLRGWNINFLSTQYLLDAGVAIGLKRFVFSSSISVFGKNLPEPVQDNAVKEPVTMYGQTKLACEHLLRWYQNKHGIKVGAVRFPWVYGPGRENGITAMYSSKLLDSLANKEDLHIASPEEQGDWLYVKDAVKALLLVLDAQNMPQVAYNIMSGLFTIREAMKIAQKICPEAKITFADNAKPSDNPYPNSYDDSNARKDLGWKPSYSLEDGFREHIAMMRGEKTA